MKPASRSAASFASAVAFLILGSSLTAAQPKDHGRSSLFLTGADFTEGRLSFEGQCGSKSHKINLHDILHRPYVDVTHGSEKRRYQKSGLFGFSACDGRRYRFDDTREYEVLEAKDLYIYAHQVWVGAGRTSHRERRYSFSVGPDELLLALTSEHLKQAFPDNHRFHDSLDRMADPAGVQEYDQRHQMFTVTRLLTASRGLER